MADSFSYQNWPGFAWRTRESGDYHADGMPRRRLGTRATLQRAAYLRAEGTVNLLEVPADGRVCVSSQSGPAWRVRTGKAWETALEAPGTFCTVISGLDGKLRAGNTNSGLSVQPSDGRTEGRTRRAQRVK